MAYENKAQREKKAKEKEKGCRLSYKYRIYPTEEQIEYFEKNFETMRYVYNHYLRRRIDAYEKTRTELRRPKIVPGTENDERPEWERDKDGKVIYEMVPNPNYDENAKAMTYFDTSKDVTQFKKVCTNEAGEYFLKEADAVAVLYALRNLESAYQNFFREVKRDPKNAGFPVFKKPGSVKKFKVAFKNLDHITLPREGSHWGYIKVPKCGDVKAVIHRIPEGTPVTLSISHDTGDRWYAVLNVKEVEIKPDSKPPKTEVAIAAGVTELAVLTDGTHYENPRRMRKMQKHIQHQERMLAKKVGAKKGEKPSKNYLKQKAKVGKLKAKLTEQRAYYTHCMTKDIVNNNGKIYTRSYGVQKLMKETKERKDIPNKVKRLWNRELADANLFEINRQLEYKSKWNGREFMCLPDNLPTSQVCSACGHKNTWNVNKLMQTWVCEECGCVHSRKDNGASNILDAAHGIELTETA